MLAGLMVAFGTIMFTIIALWPDLTNMGDDLNHMENAELEYDEDDNDGW